MCNSVQFVGCSSVLVGTVVAIFSVCTIGAAPVALPVAGLVAGIALVVFGAWLLNRADRASKDDFDALLSKKCITVMQKRPPNPPIEETVKQGSNHKIQSSATSYEKMQLPSNPNAQNISFENLHQMCDPHLQLKSKKSAAIRRRFNQTRERNRKLAVVREELLKHLANRSGGLSRSEFTTLR